jgi:hypothetical protein
VFIYLLKYRSVTTARLAKAERAAQGEFGPSPPRAGDAAPADAADGQAAAGGGGAVAEGGGATAGGGGASAVGSAGLVSLSAATLREARRVQAAAGRHAPHKPSTVVGVRARPKFGAAGSVSRTPSPMLPGEGGLGAGREENFRGLSPSGDVFLRSSPFAPGGEGPEGCEGPTPLRRAGKPSPPPIVRDAAVARPRLPCAAEGRPAERAAAAGGAEELPVGWEAAASRSTGEAYFVNVLTGESTFDRPTVPAARPAPAADSDGAEDGDGASARIGEALTAGAQQGGAARGERPRRADGNWVLDYRAPRGGGTRRGASQADTPSRVYRTSSSDDDE